MKELLSFWIITILSMQQLLAQTKTAMPPQPDIQRLMKMSPMQREKYADSLRKASGEYAEEEATKAGIALNETALPNFEIKPPVKDLARLVLIPSRPPARSELVAQIQKSKEQLQSVMPVSKVAEIEQFSKQNKPSTIHQAAIASFYNNEPEKALLLMTKVATAQPDSVIAWNNLAAMYNHTGLQHRAAPLLLYCLQQAPESSLVLNNLGQCYMGLGDLEKAQQYFIECLDINSLNPDANHSMGMLHMFVNNYDEAMKCFNRKLTVAIRSSTLAYAAKMGKKINLRALMERKNSLSGRPAKDYFEEISLGKFIIPTYPKTVPEAYQQVEEYTTFATSVQQEMQFWNSIGQTSAQQAAIEGEQKPGLYTSLVNVFLDELHEEFSPGYLSYIDENDAGTAMEIITKYENMLAKVKCPKPPAGSSIDAEIAYEIKCCTTKQQPIRNLRLAEYGSFWRPKINVAQQRAFVADHHPSR